MDRKSSNYGSQDVGNRNPPPQTIGKTMPKYYVSGKAIENARKLAAPPIPYYNWHRNDNSSWIQEASKESQQINSIYQVIS